MRSRDPWGGYRGPSQRESMRGDEHAAVAIGSGGHGVRRAAVSSGAERREPDLESAWERVRTRLKSEFGEAAFNSWLRQLVLVGNRQDTVQLEVPTRFIKDWIGSHFVDALHARWRAASQQ